jgi:tetratricopeptide (TPR) repeat protein
VGLLALPWELIQHDGRFLVRDGVVDLARTDVQDVGALAVLRPPADRFALVVNVSAPEGSGLDHERESYRISLALTRHCTLTQTELGTLDDLAETVRQAKPAGIHFSGHGGPGQLQFEDDEGRGQSVAVGELVDRLRRSLPDGSLPPFFYLANCHGNDPVPAGSGDPRRTGGGVGRPAPNEVESLAARLHREGVAQVVAYSGPILDALSTEAEAALYAAIAAGQTTRFAVRQAREALSRPVGPGQSVLRQVDPEKIDSARASHPFAWSQLVLYHRGPDHPLSQPVPAGQPRRGDDVPRRTFLDVGTRRILTTGFIGRRTDLHRLRRMVREGQRVFVLQGLGGLGKSTLAFHMVKEILHAGDDLCTLWCQDAEKAETPDQIPEALVGQLLEFCRRRFGLEWESVVQQVDCAAGADPARRFALFLQVLVDQTDRLVVYLDNLESLLIGPEDVGPADAEAFGQWRTPALQAIWQTLRQFARDTDKVTMVASCRYRHDDFRQALIPVGPLPPGALFRLMGWYPGLRRLSVRSRARLTDRMDGHPRAVEFANDLVEHALDDWKERKGRAWTLPVEPADEDLTREWTEIVEPALPKVEEKLRDDLLFDALWDRVLDDRARRMLFRMTLLRQPWDPELERELGEPGEPAETAQTTARRLRRTSLLDQVELRRRDGVVGFDTIHPATAEFVARQFGDHPELQRETHSRVGFYYVARAKTSIHLDEVIEAGHHLFQAGEYDRAYEMLGSASLGLQNHGRVREGLQVLEPFLAEGVRKAMMPDLVGRLLGAVGLAYDRLGEVERAIGYHEQALVNARAIGDRQDEGNALGNLGTAYALLGEVERAIGYHEQGLVIAREIGDRRGEGNALGNLGAVYNRLGEVERAIGYHEQALVIDREIGDRGGEGTDLGNLGAAYNRLGEVERAIGYFEQALVIDREIGDRGGEGADLGNLGLAYAQLGEVERAIGYYEQQLVITRAIGDRRGEGTALGNLGLAYADLGEVERAIGLMEQTLRIGQEIKDPQIVRYSTAQLERLRGGGPVEKPKKSGGFWRRLFGGGK